MLLLKSISSTVVTSMLLMEIALTTLPLPSKAMPTSHTHIRVMPSNYTQLKALPTSHTHLKLSGINTRVIDKTIVTTVALTTMKDMVAVVVVVVVGIERATGRAGIPHRTATAKLEAGTTDVSMEVARDISFMVEEDMTVTMTTGKEVIMNGIATGDKRIMTYNIL